MNLYAKFRELFPNPPLLVGTVLAYANGEATVELPDGGKLKARGVTVVGAKVFVRDGTIEGVAPTLTTEVIEV